MSIDITQSETTNILVPSLCYEDVIADLIEPLPSHLIEVRPGATTRDKKRAIALAYYDWRHMVNRLNRIIGGRNWQVHLEPWGNSKLIGTLTILGVSKESTGEGEEDDENGGTSAEQQVKKRLMAEHGMNYLYLLPEVWGDYDENRRRFVDPTSLVEQFYREARIDGLDLARYITLRGTPTRGGNPLPGKRKEQGGAQNEATPATSTEQGTNQDAEPSNQTQRTSIRKMCEELGRPVPEDLTTMSFSRAAELIQQLNAAAREKRGRWRSQLGRATETVNK